MEAAGDWFGDSSSVSMNAAGDRVAIGAPENDDGGSNAGHVQFMNGLFLHGCTRS